MSRATASFGTVGQLHEREEMMDDFLAMDRRALMQRALLLVGATTVAGCDLMPGAKTKAAFSARQRALLDSFAETLIPKTDTGGALEAGVPKVLAQMYSDWASKKTRTALSGALDRIDTAAKKATGKGFVELEAAARQLFLTAHDMAALKDVPPPKNAPKGNPFEPLVSVVDNGYHKLKQLTAVLYYASKLGLTEELEYQHVPGGWTASVKVTPKTRPAISFGAF